MAGGDEPRTRAKRGPSPEDLALYARLGQRIQALRKGRTMTQEALASLVGLTRASVVNVERGRQKFLVHTLVHFARALDVSPAELLSDAAIASQAPLDLLLRNVAPAEQRWIRSAMKKKD